MDRMQQARAVEPGITGRKGLESHRATIVRALTAHPIDEISLRRAVTTYVGAERHARAPLGRVIGVITRLVDSTDIVPMSVRHAVTRQVALWSVDRYFSYQDGDESGSPSIAEQSPAAPAGRGAL